MAKKKKSPQNETTKQIVEWADKDPKRTLAVSLFYADGKYRVELTGWFFNPKGEWTYTQWATKDSPFNAMKEFAEKLCVASGDEEKQREYFLQQLRDEYKQNGQAPE